MSVFASVYRAWRGKAFGNQVADLLGIHRGLYHGAMEEGGCELHMIKLYYLKEEGCSIEQVGIHSIKFLVPGLSVLRARFGPQPQIESAHGKIMAFADAESGSNFDT